MNGGVARSPSPAQSGINPSRPRPYFMTSTMPLSGAAPASGRKCSSRDWGAPRAVSARSCMRKPLPPWCRLLVLANLARRNRKPGMLRGATARAGSLGVHGLALAVGASMVQGWFVVAVALGYIGLLFLIASYGDRTKSRRRQGRSRMLIYPLSLAIYCTSWTFFGSVGFASRNGWGFLAIYIGPMLMMGLCYPLVLRIVRLAKAQNITSIADFIAARYGKHQAVAATVALIAIIGTVPYIALQLKAVSGSLGTILAHIESSTGRYQPEMGDLAFFVALAMAAFAVLFGTRQIDATEHQDGLILAIATESIVKLVAFTAVGLFVTFVLFDGPTALL